MHWKDIIAPQAFQYFMYPTAAILTAMQILELFDIIPGVNFEGICMLISFFYVLSIFLSFSEVLRR